MQFHTTLVGDLKLADVATVLMQSQERRSFNQSLLKSHIYNLDIARVT